MVITLGSLLWNWLWAPSVMEVVWFFRLNCSLAWIYETLTVLHSRKLSSPISRLVLHLGHAKESEKVSRQPRPNRSRRSISLLLPAMVPAWGRLRWWRPQSLWGCQQKGPSSFNSYWPSRCGGRLLCTVVIYCSVTWVMMWCPCQYCVCQKIVNTKHNFRACP